MRTREGKPGEYVLCVVFKGKPTHHLIVKNPDGILTINKKTFSGHKKIADLISALSSKTAGWPVALDKPVNREGADSAALKVAAKKTPAKKKAAGKGVYVHKGISREKAEELVTKAGLDDGRFLLRTREGKPGEYVLCVCFKGKPTHHLMGKNANGVYIINKKSYGDFKKPAQLIAHLGKKGPGWPVALDKPVYVERKGGGDDGAAKAAAMTAKEAKAAALATAERHSFAKAKKGGDGADFVDDEGDESGATNAFGFEGVDFEDPDGFADVLHGGPTRLASVARADKQRGGLLKKAMSQAKSLLAAIDDKEAPVLREINALKKERESLTGQHRDAPDGQTRAQIADINKQIGRGSATLQKLRHGIEDTTTDTVTAAATADLPMETSWRVEEKSKLKIVRNDSTILKIGQLQQIEHAMVQPEVQPGEVKTFDFQIGSGTPAGSLAADDAGSMDGVRVGTSSSIDGSDDNGRFKLELCSNGAIMKGGKRVAQATVGFTSNDTVRVVVDRPENAVKYYVNGRFAAVVRDELPQTGNTSAVVAVTNRRDSVQMLETSKVDTQTYNDELAKIKSVLVARQLEENAEAPAPERAFKVDAELEEKKEQIAIAMAIRSQQDDFVDERLFEKSQELGRPLREMEKKRVVRDVRQNLAVELTRSATASGSETAAGYVSLLEDKHGVASITGAAAAADAVDSKLPTGPIQVPEVGDEINALVEKAGGRGGTFGTTELLMETGEVTSPFAALLISAAANTDGGANADVLAVTKAILLVKRSAVNAKGAHDGLRPLDHALQLRSDGESYNWEMCACLLRAGGIVADGSTFHDKVANVINKFHPGNGPSQFLEMAKAICGYVDGGTNGQNLLVESVIEASDKHQDQAKNGLAAGKGKGAPTASLGTRVEVAGSFLDVLLLGQNHGIRTQNTNEVAPWFVTSSGGERAKCVQVFKEMIEVPLVEHIGSLVRMAVQDVEALDESEIVILKAYAEKMLKGAFITYFGVYNSMLTEQDFDSYMESARIRDREVNDAVHDVPRHGAQPSSVVALMLDAAGAQGDFNAYLAHLKDTVDGLQADPQVDESVTLLLGPLKKPSRIICKLALKVFLADPLCKTIKTLPYGTEARDVVRALLLAKSPGIANEIGNAIKSSAMPFVDGGASTESEIRASVLKLKNRYKRPTPGGWRDESLNVAVQGGTGHVTEIQIALTKMQLAREDLGGHHAFEEIREIEAVLNLRTPPVKLEEPKEGNVDKILEQHRLERERLENANMEKDAAFDHLLSEKKKVERLLFEKHMELQSALHELARNDAELARVASMPVHSVKQAGAPPPCQRTKWMMQSKRRRQSLRSAWPQKMKNCPSVKQRWRQTCRPQPPLWCQRPKWRVQSKRCRQSLTSYWLGKMKSCSQ